MNDGRTLEVLEIQGLVSWARRWRAVCGFQKITDAVIGCGCRGLHIIGRFLSLGYLETVVLFTEVGSGETGCCIDDLLSLWI